MHFSYRKKKVSLYSLLWWYIAMQNYSGKENSNLGSEEINKFGEWNNRVLKGIWT